MKQIILIPLGASHGENSNAVFKGPLHAEAIAKTLDIQITEKEAEAIANAFVSMSGLDYFEHVEEACKILKKEYTAEIGEKCNEVFNKITSKGCPTVCNPQIPQNFSLKVNPDFVEFQEKAFQQGKIIMLVSNGKNDAATPKAEGTENILVLSQGQAKQLIDADNATMIVNHANTADNLQKNGINAVYVQGQKLVDFL